LETQTQTQGEIEKKRAKLDKLREKAVGIEIQVTQHAAVVPGALRSARLLHFSSRALKAMLKDGKSGADANDIGEPSEEDLEAMEPVLVETAVSKCETRVNNAKKAVEEERRKRKISNETPEEAFENYIKAQEELSKFRMSWFGAFGLSLSHVVSLVSRQHRRGNPSNVR
jgi:hypothetical protein